MLDEKKIESLADALEENEKRENESKAAESESKAELTLDVLADLQDQINKLRAAGLAYEKELNKYRLGYFMPRRIEAVDIRPINLRSVWNFQDLLKEPDGGEAAQLVLRMMADLAAQCMELVDVSKIKKINIDRSVIGIKKAETIRKETSPEVKREKLKLNSLEKLIKSLRQRAPHATMKELVPMAMMFLPTLTEGTAREAIEGFFLKEAKAKK